MILGYAVLGAIWVMLGALAIRAALSASGRRRQP
jgi:hypothetical protein